MNAKKILLSAIAIILVISMLPLQTFAAIDFDLARKANVDRLDIDRGADMVRGKRSQTIDHKVLYDRHRQQ